MCNRGGSVVNVNVQDVVSGVTTVVTVASAISNVLPDSDNIIVKFFRSVINFLALNLKSRQQA